MSGSNESWVQLPPDGTGKQVDAFTVTNAAGQTLYRQGVVIADPINDTNVVSVDGLGRLRAAVDSASATPAGLSIQELLTQLVVLNRVQAHYLFEIRSALYPSQLGDDPDALFASFSDPHSSLINMVN